MKKPGLRASLPKTSRLNHPFFYVLALITLIALLVVFCFPFLSFSSRQNAAEKMASVSNKPNKLPEGLSRLPDNYQKRTVINQYMHTPGQHKIETKLQQEFSELASSQSELRTQLNVLKLKKQAQKSDKRPVEIPPEVPLTIRKSDLFFNNEAPDKALFQLNHPSQENGEDENEDQGDINSENNEQNNQPQPLNFIHQKQDNGIYNPHRLVKPISPYEVQAGTSIPTILLTAINTTLPGKVVAQVESDIYDTVSGHYLLIPKGSKIIGQYDAKVAYGQERILLVFHRIVMPNGNSIQLSQFGATDLQGSAGLGANVNNHWGRVLGAATISTMLSVGAGVAADGMPSNSNYYRSATQNAVLNGANNIAQVGSNMTDRAINVQPTLTVPAGFEFSVLVNKDMVLSPYEST